jgi:hypothetical protein
MEEGLEEGGKKEEGNVREKGQPGGRTDRKGGSTRGHTVGRQVNGDAGEEGRYVPEYTTGKQPEEEELAHTLNADTEGVVEEDEGKEGGHTCVCIVTTKSDVQRHTTGEQSEKSTQEGGGTGGYPMGKQSEDEEEDEELIRLPTPMRSDEAVQKGRSKPGNISNPPPHPYSYILTPRFSEPKP